MSSTTSRVGDPESLESTIAGIVTQPPPERTSRPDWSTTDEYQGVDVVCYGDSIQDFGPTDEVLHSHEVGWVIDNNGLQTYLEANADTEWPLPETYKALKPAAQRSDDVDAYPRYCGRATGTFYRYGMGIDARRVALALRVLTGGGHFDSSEYTLIACGDNPFVLAGPEGAVMVTLGKISRPREPAQRAATDVAAGGLQVTVEEDDPEVVAGIERFLTVVDDYFQREITGYAGLRGGQYSRHAFTTASDDQYCVEADDLATLGALAAHPEDVPVHGGGAVEGPLTHRDSEFELTWDGPRPDWDSSAPVGDAVAGGIVVGYQFEWRRLRTSRYQGTVKTYALRFVDRDAGYSEVRLSSRPTYLDEVEL